MKLSSSEELDESSFARFDENLLDFSLYYELISKPFYSMTASTLPNYERH